MTARALFAFVLGAVLSVSATAAAPRNDWRGAAQSRRPSVPFGAAHTQVTDPSRRIDANRINMLTRNDGSFGFDLALGGPGLVWPKGTIQTALFASGLWLGARVGGQVRTTVAEYSSEFGPGRMVGGTFDDPNHPDFRTYKVARFTGNPADTAHLERTACASEDPLIHHSWSEYMAGAAPYGAPWKLHRLPVTQTPQPEDSVDVPGPDVLGDQMLWSVYNDADPARHTNQAGQSAPLGVEIQQTLFSFDRTNEFGNILFLRFRIENKGGNTLDDLYVSMWSDPDLGGLADDLSGCDVGRALGYTYNAVANDAVYGRPAPALGYVLLRGPTAPGSGLPLGLTAFSRSVNGTDPASTGEAYNVMQGRSVDGSPVLDPTTGLPTTYVHGGDPVTALGWIDGDPADRRMLLSSGPSRMLPGQVQEIWAAIVIGRGTDHLTSIGTVRCLADLSHAAFAQGFSALATPASPCSTSAVTIASSCPLPAADWVSECQASGTGRFSTQRMDEIAAFVSNQSALFDWPVFPLSSFCVTVNPPGAPDLRQQARREFAAFLANYSGSRLDLSHGAGQRTWLNPLAETWSPPLRAASLGELAGTVALTPVLRDAVYLNDNVANRRALEGINAGLSAFGGGAGTAWEFFGSALDPASAPDSFSTVEIRFDGTATQKAYRYLRLETTSGAAPPQGRAYLYAGHHTVPFTCWDAATGGQLEVAFVERAVTDAGGTILGPGFQPATFDSTWRPDDSAVGGREYLFVFRRPYATAPRAALAQDGVIAAGTAPALYALWSRLRAATDVIDDGDRFQFVWGRQPSSGADSLMVDLETRSLAEPEVQQAYSELIATLAAINAGTGIGRTCVSAPTPAEIITASAGPYGTITPSGLVEARAGTSRSFAIAATCPGYRLDGVLVDGVPVGPVTEYTFDDVQTDHTIAAFFGLDLLSIVPTAGPGGAISPSGIVVPVPRGQDQTLSIAAHEGFHILDVIVDGTSVGPVSQYTFTNVQQDHTIAATFQRASFGVLSDIPVANGPVLATAVAGTTLYIGGGFTQIGPATGGGVAVLPTTGARAPGFPKVAGTVYAVARDAVGDWYIGGLFTHVGGAPRSNLARITAEGGLTSWNPGTDGAVHAIHHADGGIFIGGSFFTVGGRPRTRLAQFNSGSAVPTDWSPSPDGPVYAITGSAGGIFVAGRFDHIGGQARRDLALVSGSTGLASTWDAGAGGSTRSDWGITALALSGANLYVGGDFTQIGGQTRNFIAALDIFTGGATPWNPDANERVQALAAPAGSTIYAGGFFTTIGGQPRSRIAALDRLTGGATGWNPGANDWVEDIAVGTLVYAAGQFTFAGGQTRNHAVALDPTSGAATSWNPNASRRVHAVELGAPYIFLGGEFSSVGGLARNHLAAIDLGTGTPTSWNPFASNWVYSLALTNTTVIAGGLFTSVGGAARDRLAALDRTTGLATAWNPGADAVVRTLRATPGAIYAGGDFLRAGGADRRRVAALDPATGAATAWNPDADGPVLALEVGPSAIYAGGQFTGIGGQPRSRLAALDPVTGLATGWNPGPNLPVLALSRRGPTLFAGGEFTSVGAVPRAHVAAWEVGSGALTGWSPNVDGRVEAIEAGAARILVGGGFTNVNGLERRHFAALSELSGAPNSWNPDPEREVVTFALQGPYVIAGGLFESFDRQPQNRLAALYSTSAAYTITAGTDVNGTISPSGSVYAVAGDSVRFRFTPNPGYRIANVLVDAAPIGPVSEYTFQDIQSDHTIIGHFAPAGRTITASAGPNGIIVPSGAVSVAEGGSQTFHFAANQGSRVTDVLVDGFPTGAASSYTFSGVTTDRTIEAEFGLDSALAGVGWAADGAPVATAAGDQDRHSVVADGAGGVIMAWRDLRTGTADIYAQRLNATGVPQWPVQGVALCTAVTGQDRPQVVSDGAGGAIVMWQDPRDGLPALYAQRINRAGVPLWAANGVQVRSPVNGLASPVIAPDGAGGAIVAWQDLRSGTQIDLFAQRLNATGALMWPAAGLPVSTGPAHEQNPAIAPDGAGGVYLAWSDGRNEPANPDIYATRLAGSGAQAPGWSPGGLAVSTAPFSQGVPRVVADPSGGVYVLWLDSPTALTTQIHAQRVSATGVPRWAANGMNVAPGSRPSDYRAIADDLGGVIVAWSDYRVSIEEQDVYAQRLRPDSTRAWTTAGAPFCSFTGNQSTPSLVPDGRGGAIAAWEDFRGTTYDIFAQRVDSTGAALWTPGGVALCGAAGNQSSPAVATDGAGGALVAWIDGRSGATDLFAQRAGPGGARGFDHVITATAGPNGSIAPSGAVGVFAGSAQGFAFTPAAGFRIERVLADEIPVGALPAYQFSGIVSDHTISATFAPDSTGPAPSTENAYLLASHGFDAPSGGCRPRGWMSWDLSSRVYAHVANRYLVNDAFIAMGAQALWVGADDTSAPDEVAGWVQPFGFGNGWSQRLTSPAFSRVSHPRAVLRFDARIDLTGSGGLVPGAGNDFVAVQGLKSDGTWTFLNGRRIESGTPAVTGPAVGGRGVFKYEARLGVDGNESLGLAEPARLRIVVQTDAGGSSEDGLVPSGTGAAVIDNVSLRDSLADVVAPADFEGGGTGVWSLSAVNGAYGEGTPPVIRDLPAPGTLVQLRTGFDPADPSCAWTFTSPGDTVASGVYARLTSPWFAVAAPDSEVLITFSGRLSAREENRVLELIVRGRRTPTTTSRRRT